MFRRVRTWACSTCVFVLTLFFASASFGGTKIRVDGSDLNRAAALSGIDYGSFRVIDTDETTADRLVQVGTATRLSDATKIYLNAETVETTSSAARAMRNITVPAQGKQLHLVQFAGPIKQEWVDALVADGFRIVNYIPNNAYLVWGQPGAITKLQARAADTKSALQWEGHWRDEWKVAPRVLGSSKDKRLPADKLSVQLVEDKNTNAATLAALLAAGAAFVSEPRPNLGYLNFVIKLDPSQLSILTAQPDVISIHRYEEPRLLDESQGMVLAGNLNGNVPNPGDYLTTLANWGFTQAQFDASGLVVDVSDDGVDNGTTTPNHFAFYRNGNKSDVSRLVYRVTQGFSGSDNGLGNGGHGQLNASIIGGYVPTGSVTVNGHTTSTTTFPHADALGFRYGLGIAPFVRLGNSTIYDPGFTNPSFDGLESDAYAAGARISSNSWGTANLGQYDGTAQAYDALVRDAQSGTSGNQQMVIVYSAGNSGSAAGTTAPPGTAKNVITVGAAEGVRSEAIAAGGLDSAGTDGSNASDPFANSANDIAGFSSRGPCVDGRVKPDLMAGGTHITGVTFVTPASTQNGTAASTYRASGVSGLIGNTPAAGEAADFFPTVNGGSPPYNQAQQWWTTATGTSHSCPAISGAAALVYQQFINNPGYLASNRTPAASAPPSPALVKAYLMNSARYMTGAAANDALPSNAQGMGHGNLGMAFDGVTRIVRDQVAADRFTATGQTRKFTGAITDTSKPFRVTLAWTDPVGSTSSSAYVNNLDLTVTANGQVYKGNVFAPSGGTSVTGGSADPRNNVESVFLPAGTSGTFSIIVSGANIAGVADPTVAGNNQDFALVVYNGNSVVAPALSAGAPTFGDGNVFQRNDCNTLTVPLSNDGSALATAVSAVLSSSTPGVSVLQANSTYPDLASNSTQSNNTPFQASTASSIPCGTVADFTLTISYTGAGSPTVSHFSRQLGSVDTSNYVFTSSSGATIPAGGTLVAGSQSDDGLTTITTPADFNFTVYSTAVPGGSTIRASTNGDLQMATTGSTAYTHQTLPASIDPVGFSPTPFPANLPTLFPYWDDLTLVTPPSSNGIYTNLIGSAPNRTYIIEWRGQSFTHGPTVDFAIRFHENSSTFDYIYQNTADNNGDSATIGVQAASSGTQFTQYSFNTASVSSGTMLTASLPVCLTGSAPCNVAAPSITSASPPSPVVVGSPYSFNFTAAGNPAPTFALTGGTFPSGLSLTSGGLLSGTPTSAGNGSFPNITVTASNTVAPNATQTFSLSAVTIFANFIASFGLTGPNAAALADPNGDGLPNLLSYAFAFNPTRNHGSYERGLVRNYGGLNYLSIRFPRSSIATDLTYIVEATSDLTGAWTELAHSTAGGALTATGGVVVSDTGGPPEYLDEVRDTVVVGASSRRFIRLRVTSP